MLPIYLSLSLFFLSLSLSLSVSLHTSKDWRIYCAHHAFYFVIFNMAWMKQCFERIYTFREDATEEELIRDLTRYPQKWVTKGDLGRDKAIMVFVWTRWSGTSGFVDHEGNGMVEGAGWYMVDALVLVGGKGHDALWIIGWYIYKDNVYQYWNREDLVSVKWGAIDCVLINRMIVCYCISSMN